MEKSYEFKGASVEQAKKRGLAELGVEEEDVTVEVVSKGGIFAKATVKITVKEKEETEAEEEELPPTYEELARKGEMFKNYDDYKTFASERGIDEEEQEEKKPQRRERVREEEPDELYEYKK
ncbi:MAG: Jag N-terminal domain-containing protein [Clostridia bacterium]|nr:Jag N-terminal domain-containing protein [Clostridia bacterium]